MADVVIRHMWNQAELSRLAHGETEGVRRDMLRRGYRVQARAVQILKEEGRWDHGNLAGSITVAPLHTANVLAVRVGTNKDYAMFVEEGTGIYGPRHARIYPTTKKVMTWVPRKVSGSFIKTKDRSRVFARSTKGMKGAHFMRRALAAAGGR